MESRMILLYGGSNA